MSPIMLQSVEKLYIDCTNCGIIVKKEQFRSQFIVSIRIPTVTLNYVASPALAGSLFQGFCARLYKGVF